MRLVGEAAAAQVVERLLAVLALGQDAVVEGDRRVEHVAQSLAPRVVAAGAFSDSSTPARRARRRSASGKSIESRSMTKLKTSPPRPQPKHFQVSRAGVTVNDGVFSPWKGHSPLYEAPALRSWTVSPIRSTRLIFCLISAATPTDVVRLLAYCSRLYLMGRGTAARRVTRMSLTCSRYLRCAGHTYGLVKT